MHHTMSKWVAALAVIAASGAAAPAMACGGLVAGGCSPCGPAYVSPCGGYGYAGGVYEQLPDPTPATPQYFYANQGPTFSGPGMFAPTPTYQETAIGWRGYGYGARYDGGPYADPLGHAYAPAYRGPAIYSYAPRATYRARPSYRYGYSMRPRIRYGYAPRSYTPRYAGYQAYRHAGPRAVYAPRHGHYPAAYRPLRRAY